MKLIVECNEELVNIFFLEKDWEIVIEWVFFNNLLFLFVDCWEY